MTDKNELLFGLGIGAVALILAIAGLVLPESTGCPSTFPYGNLTDVPSTFPYGNLTDVPYIINGTNGLDFNYTGTIFLFNGSQGIQGIQGNTGATGAIGATGAKGDKGDIGDVSGYYNQGLNTTESPTFAGLTLNGNLTTSYYVDGVDISALLLKTTKITDLGSIWDKTTKIAYGDTSFADQNVLTSSSPSFVGLTLSGLVKFYGDSSHYWDMLYGGTNLIIQPEQAGLGTIAIRDNSANPTIVLNPYTGGVTMKGAYLGANIPLISFTTTQSGNMEFQWASAYNDANSISLVKVTGGALQCLIIDSTGYLRVGGGYKSVDGTSGVTQDITVLTALPSTFATLHFKNGLFVGST